MHARIAVYEFQPGKREAVYQRAEAELSPILRSLPGFHRYEVILAAGPNSLVSISWWDSEEQAQAAVRAAAAWVEANVREHVVFVETRTGPVVFSHDKDE